MLRRISVSSLSDSKILGKKKKWQQLQWFNADISTLALNRAAPQIEAIDRRIGNYEQRRTEEMKAIEQHSEAAARRLAASTDVIEGEFTEAVE